jgi:hypothetical protein
MAQKRMISRSLALSRKVNRLPIKQELIYVRCIPFLDDWGDIDKEPETIKAMVFPKRKEISESDIKMFIKLAKMEDAEGETLVIEYSDCLHFNAFEEWNILNIEKRAKSRFKRNPLESPRIPNNSPELPSQERVGEESIALGEVRDAIAHTPREEAVRFFLIVEMGGDEFESLCLKVAQSTNAPLELVRRELIKFKNYWTEHTPSGQKQLWETKKTFEVKRRLVTWFSNVRDFNKPGITNRFTAEIV